MTHHHQDPKFGGGGLKGYSASLDGGLAAEVIAVP